MNTLEIPKLGPRVSTGKGSKQTYSTPKDFMAAVVQRFGQPTFDLAADGDNSKATCYFDEQRDSLKQPWHRLEPGLFWLNPPFYDIAPWARKCVEEEALGANILFLVPASVGSNWFAEYVHKRALVLFLSPRLNFDGIAPYPKDTMLCCYRYDQEPGYDVWRWKT